MADTIIEKSATPPPDSSAVAASVAKFVSLLDEGLTHEKLTALMARHDDPDERGELGWHLQVFAMSYPLVDVLDNTRPSVSEPIRVNTDTIHPQGLEPLDTFPRSQVQGKPRKSIVRTLLQD